jgi:hypothetical protein
MAPSRNGFGLCCIRLMQLIQSNPVSVAFVNGNFSFRRDRTDLHRALSVAPLHSPRQLPPYHDHLSEIARPGSDLLPVDIMRKAFFDAKCGRARAKRSGADELKGQFPQGLRSVCTLPSQSFAAKPGG